MKKITIICQIYLLMLLLSSCAFSVTGYQGEKSDHFDGQRFFNPGVIDKNFSDVIKWWWNRVPAKWPDNIDVSVKKMEPSSSLSVTFVNHSTFLIQMYGVNILTDPIWSERASPVSFAGPKRVREPGIKFDDLPRVDIVLISHNHYDHMDIDTLVALEKKFSPHFITGLGNKEFLIQEGLIKVTELDWWNKIETNGLNIIFTPAQHFSARGLMDRNKTLWGSFVVKSDKGSIYFAGDTGFSDHFQKIGNKYGPFQLSLIPIGAYSPRWFMKTHHIDPKEAVLAHLALRSSYSVGMHFGTFQLTDESVDQPIFDLEKALIDQKIDKNRFEALDFGETKHL